MIWYMQYVVVRYFITILHIGNAIFFSYNTNPRWTHILYYIRGEENKHEDSGAA